MTQRELFFKHLGQTSPAPMGLEIDRAEGIYLYDTCGKQYIDLISGVSVSNIGHRHPKVIKAIEQQLNKYMHLMVYGEYIQTTQVGLATKLSKILPGNIDSVYFVNSGSEAVEGAIKLAKRTTERYNVVSFKNAYHGSTHGALSIMGNETMRNAFRPLLPGITQIEFNNTADFYKIDKTTACVVVEPIQGEGGIILPYDNFLTKLRQHCTENGALLIFDEIQTGFGRTGSLFAANTFGVIPDIICLAKALGGGMPLGAFAASSEIMRNLTFDPPLGHITTFGGHPVSCAAALATLEVMEEENIVATVNCKGERFRRNLSHHLISDIRGKGLFLAVTLKNIDIFKLIHTAISCGILLDPFLFCNNAFRISPPLTITESQIDCACEKIIAALDKMTH